MKPDPDVRQVGTLRYCREVGCEVSRLLVNLGLHWGLTDADDGVLLPFRKRGAAVPPPLVTALAERHGMCLAQNYGTGMPKRKEIKLR